MGGATLTGSCLCGAVRYELTKAPVWAHSCHCSRCRKASGSAFAANLFFPRDALRYTQGDEAVQTFRLPEAEAFTHVFCGRCGSTLPFPSMRKELVGVPMGGLDRDPGYKLQAHIFVDSKAPWFDISDPLPQHSGGLGSGKPMRSRGRAT